MPGALIVCSSELEKWPGVAGAFSVDGLSVCLMELRSGGTVGSFLCYCARFRFATARFAMAAVKGIINGMKSKGLYS